MTARSATITSLPSRAEACTTAVECVPGWRPCAGQRRLVARANASRGWLEIKSGLELFFLRANSPAITAAARDSRAARSLFSSSTNTRSAGVACAMLAIPLTLAVPSPNTSPCTASATALSERVMGFSIRIGEKGKALLGLELSHGEESLLDQLHCPWAGRRFHPAYLVGAGRHHPSCVCQLVDRLSQRLVLKCSFWLLALSF